MGSLGWQELVIVLVIVIIIFGAGKITDVGGALGKSMRDFKAATSEDSADTTSDDAESRPLNAQTTTPLERRDEPLVAAGDRRDEVLVNAGERREQRGVRADEI